MLQAPVQEPATDAADDVADGGAEQEPGDRGVRAGAHVVPDLVTGDRPDQHEEQAESFDEDQRITRLRLVLLMRHFMGVHFALTAVEAPERDRVVIVGSVR